MSDISGAMEKDMAEFNRQRSSKEIVRRIRRTAEMSAEVMRDRERTDGWEGSERVARQFDRLAKMATELESATHEPPDEPSVMGGALGLLPKPKPPSGVELIEWCVHMIQTTCDAMNLDPAQWLNDSAAQGESAPPPVPGLSDVVQILEDGKEPASVFHLRGAIIQALMKLHELHPEAWPRPTKAPSLPEMIWDPCSQGGLWKCKACGESYCSPPWNKTSAAMDHAAHCSASTKEPVRLRKGDCVENRLGHPGIVHSVDGYRAVVSWRGGGVGTVSQSTLTLRNCEAADSAPGE